MLLLMAGASAVIYFYVEYSALIDDRLSGQIFNNASLVFSAPVEVLVGENITLDAVETRLRKALYSSSAQDSAGAGRYSVEGSRIDVYPGQASYFRTGDPVEGPAELEFAAGRLTSISSLDQHSPLDHYELEPEVITTLFDQNRSKRRLVQYKDLPPVLVNAVLAAEDRRFFSHHGVNFFRILAAAVRDLRADQRLQGGSTLTMQLARNFFLTPRRTFRRKAREILLAMMLEQRLSKEQIFELYSNEIYLGQRGSFSVYGFGEAADAYFNKDVSSLTLPEAALLAGMIRGPNLYSPFKYPNRALATRNQVLGRMVENGFITPQQAREAQAAPLSVTRRNVDANEAPYFVDMVKDQLLAHFSERDLISQSYRIYTTLDPDLQAAASTAVRDGMQEVDQKLDQRHPRKGANPPAQQHPQVALVALDPHTGGVRALVGGRDYAASQLNHALAKRQPGSTFKPFVYAAALSSGVDGSSPLVTASTVLQDEPTTFEFDGKDYEPHNDKDEYYGMVTVREALTFSLNVATVHLAEMTGYDKVKQVAQAAGINGALEATPAMALGAYETTPVEMAGAYTIFANGGQYEAPGLILAVKDSNGETLWQPPPVTRRVLDARVAYLTDSLMQSVIDHGTGAGVRTRGFYLPAAGKTGTTHDGWFAGFTSNLLAVAWVGYDDNRDLKLYGATSALPVWTDFMKAATQLPDFNNVQAFDPPLGVVTAPVDSKTLLMTVSNPVNTPEEVYIEGTEPGAGGAASGLSALIRKILPFGHSREATAANANTAPAAEQPPGLDSAAQAPEESTPSADPAPADAPAAKNKKEGVLHKIVSIFKHKSEKSKAPPPPNPQP